MTNFLRIPAPLAARMAQNELIYHAYIFALAAHGAVGQMRETKEEPSTPYIVHPIEVANTVAMLQNSTDEQIIAALLHDTVEDTKTDLMVIRRMFGPLVALYVLGLTDMFTKESHPQHNRAARKELELIRLAGVPNAVKTIKLADGLSNTPSIAENKPKFMPTYGPEKRAAWRVLKGGDEGLWRRLDEELKKWGY